MGVIFRQAELDNGLTIVAEVDPSAASCAAGFFVRTGARDETPAMMGVSHFLEHMMFKGTPKRSASMLNEDFDRIGARNNAYTSSELTCFYATVLPERLLGEGNALEILSDMMRPSLRQEDFDVEKNVILEEIAMYDDNPFWVLYERSMEEYFKGHPLGHRVLGTRETIADLSRDQMQGYFDARYSGDNTTVALAGRVDFDRVVEEIGSLCGGWSRTGVTRDVSRVDGRGARIDESRGNVHRGYGLMIWPGPSVQDERRYAGMLLAQVLGGADNSRLHWALIETGLAEEAESAFDARDGTGDFMAYFSCDPAKLERVRGIVEEQMRSLPETLAEGDLEKIRAKIATGTTVGGESPSGRMQRLGRHWTYLREYRTLEEELERIRSVTVEDVRGLLAEYPCEPRFVGVMTPGAG